MILRPSLRIDRTRTLETFGRLRKFLIQRFDEFAPADFQQEALQLRISGLVSRAYGHQQPLELYLSVVTVREVISCIELSHLCPTEVIGHGDQELLPLLRVPLARGNGGKRLFAFSPRSCVT